jgi:hypothetical protein
VGALTARKPAPGAIRCRLPGGSDDRARRPIASTATQQKYSTQALHADLIGDNVAIAEGIRARGCAPVLELARLLVAEGHDPRQALEVFRDGALALRVRSIGEAAAIAINSKGTAFVRCRRVVRTAPTVAPIGREDLR